MKRIMKSALLLGCVVAGLEVGTANAGENKTSVDGKMSADSGTVWNSVVEETRLTGTLDERASWLTLDQPVYFAKGSKSERVVRKVKVNVPGNLRDKIPAIEHRHVVVDGPMECTMEFSPWTASCGLTIKHVEVIK